MTDRHERRRWPRLDRSEFNRPTLEVARKLLGKVIVRRVSADPGGEEGDPAGLRQAPHREVQALITEVEAYKGPRDLGSHAARGRRTPRVEPLYDDGGTVYVYFCYGMHWMLNFSTAGRERPEAVLIRGVLPVEVLGSPPDRTHPRRRARGSGDVGEPARTHVRAPDQSQVLGAVRSGTQARVQDGRQGTSRGHVVRPERMEVSGPGRVTRHLSIDRNLNRVDACSSESLWVEDRGYRVPTRCVIRGPRVGIDYAGPFWASRPWRFRVDLSLWIVGG